MMNYMAFLFSTSVKRCAVFLEFIHGYIYLKRTHYFSISYPGRVVREPVSANPTKVIKVNRSKEFLL